MQMPWTMSVHGTRNMDIKMPNLLCSKRQQQFLSLIRNRFLRIQTCEQYEKLFPRHIEIHFQLAFHHLLLPAIHRKFFGCLHAFLRNNFPQTMAMDSLPPLRILARNQTAVDAYWLWLQKYPQSCSDRPEIAEFANQYGVLFQTDNSYWLNKILKPDKKRAHSSIDLDDRGRGWSSHETWPQGWHSSSSWQNKSWTRH